MMNSSARSKCGRRADILRSRRHRIHHRPKLARCAVAYEENQNPPERPVRDLLGFENSDGVIVALFFGGWMRRREFIADQSYRCSLRRPGKWHKADKQN